ncbi:unnamed protein product, partial [Medioppia subpectinata]
LCIPVKAGEIGEIVGKIQESDPARAYPGYHNVEATKKKVVKDVLSKGDSAFLSGDLMEMDELGFLYFRDRTGDTFRWKGENVSTTEIEAIIQKVIRLNDCVVFGVAIENSEGKAGMAVLTRPTEGTLDMKQLYARLKDEIPSYAIPLFVRLVDKIELTGSYKLQKHSLEKEAFNPNVVKDELYFLDKKSDSYVTITPQLYQQIQSGNKSLKMVMVDKIELTGSYKLQKHSLEKEAFNPNVVKDELYFLDKKSDSYVTITPQLYQQIQSGNVLL